MGKEPRPARCGHSWGRSPVLPALCTVGERAPSCPLWALLREEPDPARCVHCWGKSPVLPAMGTVGEGALPCLLCTLLGLHGEGAPSCPLSQELQGAAVPAESTVPQRTGPHGVHGARADLGLGVPGVWQACWQVGLPLPALPSSLFSSGVSPLLLCFFLFRLGSVSFCLRPSLSSLTFLCPLLLLGLSLARCSPPSSSFFSAGCVHERPTGRPVGCVTMWS